MNYWIFKVDPEKYDLDKRLQDPAPHMVWAMTRYQERIQPGDTVFIWRAGTPRGLCAVMEVEANPYEPEQEKALDKFVDPFETTATSLTPWVKCRLTQRFPLIEASIIKKIPGLELFSFFSAFPKATNFSITRPEGAILLELIEKSLTEVPQKKSQAAQKPAAKVKKAGPVRASGAGKNKPVKAASQPAEFELLKCATCGRYVIKSDTDRHIREVHAGQPVEWKKTK